MLTGLPEGEECTGGAKEMIAHFPKWMKVINPQVWKSSIFQTV